MCGKRNNASSGIFNHLVVCKYCHQLFKVRESCFQYSDKFSSVETIVNIFNQTMGEKNEGVFHPGESLHNLWMQFEYFSTGFAKKVGMEVLDVGVDLAASAALGLAVGGPHTAATTVVGGATTKIIHTSVTNISKKNTRDSEMRVNHQHVQSQPLPPIEAAKSMNVFLPANDPSVRYYAYIWPGYNRARRSGLSCEQDFANALIGRLTGSPDFNLKRIIYYKPPKSGGVNNDLINYLFIIRKMFSQSDDYTDTFKTLDLFWLMSRNWPMLDYLFFNYGFFKYFNDFKNILPFRVNFDQNKKDEVVRNFLYTSRFYFLSKDFYLESFFRVIIPTYHFIIRTFRKNNTTHTSRNALRSFLDNIDKKTDCRMQAHHERKGLFSNIKSIGENVFHRTLAKKYAHEMKLSEKYSLFFIFIEEFSKNICHMDLDLQLNFLNVLFCQFVDINFQIDDQQDTNYFYSMMIEFDRCFDDIQRQEPTRAINERFRCHQGVEKKLRKFFESYRNQSELFFSSKEFEKLKCFIRKKLYSISHKQNIGKEITNIGSFKIVQKFLDTLLNDGFAVFEKEFMQFYLHNPSYRQVLDTGISDGVIRAVAILVISCFRNKIDSGSHKSILNTLAGSIGYTRITFGTTHYMYELLNGESFITTLLGCGRSVNFIKSAIIGPNIVNLFTDLAVQAGKQYVYQQMDKKCLVLVDNLVIPFSTNAPHEYSIIEHGSQQMSSVRSSESTASIASLSDEQSKEQFFTQIFIYLCVSQNIQTTGVEVTQLHPDPVKQICLQYIAEILFKKYLDQASACAKDYAHGNFSDRQIESYAQIFLAVSDCCLKFIFLKKNMQIVLDYQNNPKMDHSEHSEYLRHINKSLQLNEEFGKSINALKGLMHLSRDIFEDSSNFVQKKNSNSLSAYRDTIQRIHIDIQGFENRAQILNNRIEELSAAIYHGSQRFSSSSSSLSSNENQNLQSDDEQKKEDEYARRLNLGLRLVKPFANLTGTEQIVLYRDFGRVLRHLFQNVKKPSELLSCEQNLTEILTQIRTAHRVHESQIKEFVKVYFDYSHAVSETELFIHYVRVYQFLQERLRLEYFDSSKTYIENLFEHLDSDEPLRYGTEVKASIENIKELLQQLQSEQKLYNFCSL